MFCLIFGSVWIPAWKHMLEHQISQTFQTSSDLNHHPVTSIPLSIGKMLCMPHRYIRQRKYILLQSRIGTFRHKDWLDDGFLEMQPMLLNHYWSKFYLLFSFSFFIYPRVFLSSHPLLVRVISFAILLKLRHSEMSHGIVFILAWEQLPFTMACPTL